VGRQTSAGKVPARIRPVFRDREDLSSSTDLADTVKQALAESENLIVICSPSAAASKWVNEEIREFARLGREKRIFCIIVDGEPDEDGSLSACFPPALTEIGHREPLAADVRKWADGKHVARLKLIAGLLGLRLDELRQRDLQRRRKRQALSGIGLAAVLALAIMTVVSQVSERHEREKAEQLATFVVDLGERLKSDSDLETLALISAEAARHLEGLDPDRLSPETGRKVALAIRQMARVNQLQGESAEALDAFQRSRDLLQGLRHKYPQSQDLIFELGNAEFYIGDLYFRQSRIDEALVAMQAYHSNTRTLVELEPDNPDWIMELAYSHNNLAALSLESGRGIDKVLLSHVEEAIRLMEKASSMRPEDNAVADGYATILAWAADAQRQACNLEEAMSLRNKARDLAGSAARTDPANNDLKKRYAFATSGVARIQIMMGRLDLAEKSLEETISALQQLSASDPSNVLYREEALLRRALLAKLLADTDRLEQARSMMEELEAEFATIGEFTNQAEEIEEAYITFLLAYADTEFRLGKLESAKSHLQMVSKMQADNEGIQSEDMFDTQRLVKARYQWWLLNAGDGVDHRGQIPEFDHDPDTEFRSCIEADSAARMAVIGGYQDNALSEVAYLRERGYADPEFIRFCKRENLCGGP
jgi:tetratricopeptide (TPR) repeat protein